MINYIGNICKTQIISIKSALNLLAFLLVRCFFKRINGNESAKTFLRPSRNHLMRLEFKLLKKWDYFFLII